MGEMTEETAERLIAVVATMPAKIAVLNERTRELPQLGKDVAVIKAQMEQLFGNGQKGMLHEIREVFTNHELRDNERFEELHGAITVNRMTNKLLRSKMAMVAAAIGVMGGILSFLFEVGKFAYETKLLPWGR